MSEIKVQTVRTEVSPRQVSSTPPPKDTLEPLSEAGSRAVSADTKLAGSRQDQIKPSANNERDFTSSQPVSDEDVQEAVAKLNEFVQTTQRRLDFQVDEDSGRSIIRVYDKDTSELVRQIPSEQALELARRLGDDEPSFLFNAEV